MSRKIAKDPAEKLLKAYYNILSGSIIYESALIKVGTRIPQGQTKYILLYIEDISPMNTGDKIIYNATVTLECVSMQGTTEGDSSIVNSLSEQVMELVGDPDMFIMTGFKVCTSIFDGSEPSSELTDTNFITSRKIRMSNIIEQS